MSLVNGHNDLKQPAACHKPTEDIQGPNLATSLRGRKPRFKSREEAEEEEMAAMPRHMAGALTCAL